MPESTNNWDELTINAKVTIIKKYKINKMGLCELIYLDASIERLSMDNLLKRAIDLIQELYEFYAVDRMNFND
jgi:hypothetical protein